MKKDLGIAAAGVLVILGVTYALSTARPASTPPPSTAASDTPATSSPAAKKAAGNVVMRVNGEEVTEGDFNLYIAQASPQEAPFLATPQGRRMVADEIVRMKALEQEARRAGLDRDPEIKSRLEMTESSVLAAAALRKVVGQPDETKMRAMYEEMKPTLSTIELSHILVAYQGGAVPPRSGAPLPVERAMEKARAIEQELRRGAPFDRVAASVSDETQSAQQGGALGPMPANALPPEIASVVTKLQPGQMSAPVRSQLGVHIFKAGKRETRSYEDVKEMLAQRVQRESAEAQVAKLTSSADVYLDPKFFPKAEAPAGQQPAPGAAQKPRS